MRKIVIFLVFFPIVLLAQVSFDTYPLNRQLVSRDEATNTGEVIISGEVDQSNSPYNSIRIDIYREGVLYDTETQSLLYQNDIASFHFNLKISSELANYSFRVLGDTGSGLILEKSIDSIVAGDVYIIQGQSNAEARMRDGDSSNSLISDFIRVYANGTDVSGDLVNNDKWYIGQGDGRRMSNGNTGQWGLKLARMIVDSLQIPVAIFNAGHGPKAISFFQPPSDYQTSLNSNYGRLYYRLNKTGLKNHVKSLLWSQGEQDAIDHTSVSDYKNSFLTLYNSWKTDYPSIEDFYIFQTKNGCGAEESSLMKIKEAQRELSTESLSDIHLLSVSALSTSSDYCHFIFQNGYESMGKRVFDLIKRNNYSVTTDIEIDHPMILDAYLTDEHTLVIETDAKELFIKNPPATDFLLDNSGMSHIDDVKVEGNKILLSLSENPGSFSTISYLGIYYAGSTNNLITNTNDLELVSFYQFPVDVSRFTVWQSDKTWTNGAPDKDKFVILNGGYSALDGNITAKNLVINSALNFDNSTLNSVVVYGDLLVADSGSFTIGDTESLVMYNDNAKIKGVVTKKERSTPTNNTYDVTYWSSPVTNESVEHVFNGVNPERIFYHDQSLSNAIDDSDNTYYNVWQKATGQMIPGWGYAADGLTGTTGIQELEFLGIPNNGIIKIPIKGYTNDNLDNDYCFIGNPYPSAINIIDFFDENKTVIQEVVYLWTHATPLSNGNSGDYLSSDYAIFNRTGGVASSNGGAKPRDTLGSAQGFFVKAESIGDIVFKNYMRRQDQNDQFFKSVRSKSNLSEKEDKDRIWLNLTSDQGGFSQILIGFNDVSNDSFDPGYDAVRLDGGNPINFYSVKKESKLVIQSLNSFTNEKEIQLGFHCGVAPRNMTIRIHDAEGILKESEIYLEDHLLNIYHDLKKSAYVFEQEAICKNNNRFTLKFTGSLLAVDDEEIKSQLIIRQNSGNFRVESDVKVISLKIHDVLGRYLINIKPNRMIFDIESTNIKNGNILFVEVVLEDNVVIKRKIIKYKN